MLAGLRVRSVLLLAGLIVVADVLVFGAVWRHRELSLLVGGGLVLAAGAVAAATGALPDDQRDQLLALANAITAALVPGVTSSRPLPALRRRPTGRALVGVMTPALIGKNPFS